MWTKILEGFAPALFILLILYHLFSDISSCQDAGKKIISQSKRDPLSRKRTIFFAVLFIASFNLADKTWVTVVALLFAWNLWTYIKGEHIHDNGITCQGRYIDNRWIYSYRWLSEKEELEIKITYNKTKTSQSNCVFKIENKDKEVLIELFKTWQVPCVE